MHSPSKMLRVATVWPLFSLPFLIAVAASAQTAPPSTPPPANDATVMSAFKVVTTEDTGYIATTATPFKTRQAIVDIPQAITVLTRDIISDIGEYDLAKTLTYVGGVPKFGGELFQLRGSNSTSTYPVVDGQISRTVYMDNLFIDSIEIIRGPAALLYPNSQLSGVINKTTKRPQSRAATSLTASITDYGLYRGVLDTTGPIGALGAGQLNYRLVGGVSGGDAYFTNTKEDREMLHPSLEWDYANTTVLIAYDYQKITRPSNPTAVLQPNGKIFTGVGRKNSLFMPPGASETHEHNGVRSNVVHQYSRNWESRLGLDWNKMHRTGSIVLPTGGVNWDTRTISLFNRRNDIALENASVSLDNNGTYEIFGVKNQSTFGFTNTIQKAVQKLWTNNDFGGPGNRFAVRPIDNPNVNTLPVLPFGSYIAPANPGSRVRDEFFNAYFQQNVEVIKDHLLLVGGYAKFHDETSNIPNITSTAGTIVNVDSNLHRFGVVAQFFNKQLAVYATQANTQLPRSPTSILQDGSSAPGPDGKGKEAGIKLSLLENKLNTTISVFDLETTNLSIFGGVLPDGRTYVIPLGKTRAKGFDGDVTLALGKGLQLIGSFYRGTVKDQTGAPIDDSYKSTISMLAKYSFKDGPVKGLSLGAGAYKISGRITSTAALTYANKPAFILNRAEPIVKLFGTYVWDKHWSFKVELENVFDNLSPLAINSATLLETNIGRSFTFHTTYRF